MTNSDTREWSQKLVGNTLGIANTLVSVWHSLLMGCSGKDIANGEDVIVGLLHKGLVMVTDDGRVFVRNQRTGQWGEKTARNREGYIVVHVQLARGKRAYAYAHRLGWISRNGRIPRGLVVNHRNGIRHDNSPGNIEVVTQRENVIHARDTLGARFGRSKLTENDVRAIRALRSEGATYDALGKQFGISGNQASLVARRKCWGHVE